MVVGHGMVAEHLCRTLERSGALKRYRVTVLAEEERLAYDRVKLTEVVKGAPVESLQLSNTKWFESAGIELRLGEPALSLDRSAQLVRTATGFYPYDKLALATGSRPNVPQVEGADDPRVLTYRSSGDALSIREGVLRCSAQDQSVVVVGAGLLGLEVAEAAQSLGCKVELVESGPHLLPRQLDGGAGRHLEALLRKAAFVVHTAARVRALEPTGENLCVALEDGTRLPAGLVVFAIGVRPRDELARSAAIACDLFGGVVVDDRMQTSDPQVFAIGECARHRGSTYGIVAPGYLMADTLAAVLMGKEATFSAGTDMLRLKLPQIDLTCMGESNVRDPSTKAVERKASEGLQQLVLRRGRVVGASAIGSWEEFPGVQQAIITKQRIRSADIRRFLQGGDLLGDSGVRLDLWPDSATVCGCTGVTCGSLRAACSAGAQTVAELGKETGAGSVCGTCSPLLGSFVGERVAAPARLQGLLTWSILALVLSAVAWFAPPIALSESVQTGIWDVLWRDPVAKQVSGFSLLGLGLAAGALGLRKRTPWLQWGSFAGWRTVHAAIGFAILLGFGLHTGFRLGHNLDFALAMTFLATSAAGAVAGIATALERRMAAGRGPLLRRRSGRLHLWLSWPAPVLVLFHMAKVYFF